MKRQYVDLNNLPPWIIRRDDGKLMINPEIPLKQEDISAAVAMAKLMNYEDHKYRHTRHELETEVEKSHMVTTYYSALLKDKEEKEKLQ